MYRCEVCAGLSKRGQQRFVFTTYRLVPAKTFTQIVPGTNGARRDFVEQRVPAHREIEREFALCTDCLALLEDGVSFRRLNELRGKKYAKTNPIAQEKVDLETPLNLSAPSAKQGFGG